MVHECYCLYGLQMFIRTNSLMTIHPSPSSLVYRFARLVSCYHLLLHNYYVILFWKEYQYVKLELFSNYCMSYNLNEANNAEISSQQIIFDFRNKEFFLVLSRITIFYTKTGESFKVKIISI